MFSFLKNTTGTKSLEGIEERSPSVTQKEKVQQAEPQQAFQVPEPGKANSAYTSTFSKLEENKTEHQESKPDLQRPDKKVFTYIKEQETKPALVVNLTKDEISRRRAWGV
ncbi:hypothetical protein ACS0TY_005930 [Phlomoides rotata]